MADNDLSNRPPFSDLPAASGTAVADRSPGVLSGSGLDRLKKMSTTAGLGSGDYAAINTLAVIALTAALLGGLAALLWVAMLAVPVVAAVVAVVAVRQIRDSNGTQTGRREALAALLISLGVVGYVVGGRVLNDLRTKPDREEILGVISEFDKAMAANEPGRAYQLTTPAFRTRVAEKKWRAMFAEFEAVPELGAIVGVNWNNVPLAFEEGPQGGNRLAYANVLFRYRRGAEPGRLTLAFARVDGKWLINNIEKLFGKAAKSADQGGPAAEADSSP